MLRSPSQCATCLLEHRIPSLTVGEFLTEVVNGVFFLSRFILLTKNTTYTLFKHNQIHDQWSSPNRQRQNQRLKQILFDTVKSFLAILGPITRLIFLKKLEYRRTRGSHVGNKSGNIIQAIEKTSDLLLSFGRRHLLYCFALAGSTSIPLSLIISPTTYHNEYQKYTYWDSNGVYTFSNAGIASTNAQRVPLHQSI